jgi:hypothetical protein
MGADDWEQRLFCGFEKRYCVVCNKRTFHDLVVRRRVFPSDELSGRMKEILEAELICTICKYPNKPTHTVIQHI